MVNSLGGFYPELATNDRPKDIASFDQAAAILISTVRTIAAMSYRQQNGMPSVYPETSRSYAENFLHMMFSTRLKHT